MPMISAKASNNKFIISSKRHIATLHISKIEISRSLSSSSVMIVYLIFKNSPSQASPLGTAYITTLKSLTNLYTNNLLLKSVSKSISNSPKTGCIDVRF